MKLIPKGKFGLSMKDIKKDIQYKLMHLNELNSEEKQDLMKQIRAAWSGAEDGDLSDESSFNEQMTYENKTDFDPGRGFLLNSDEQEEFFDNYGYTKVKNPNYALVNKASQYHRSKGKEVPMYQRHEHEIPREQLQVLGNRMSTSNLLENAASFPTALYVNPNRNKDGLYDFYVNAWDLNDYGNEAGEVGFMYNDLQKYANYLDEVGNPFVQTSGITKIDPKIRPMFENHLEEKLDENIKNYSFDEIASGLYQLIPYLGKFKYDWWTGNRTYENKAQESLLDYLNSFEGNYSRNSKQIKNFNKLFKNHFNTIYDGEITVTPDKVYLAK